MTQKEPVDEDLKQAVDFNKQLHNLHLNEVIVGDVEELPVDIFNKTFERLVKKPGDKYDFFIKGGNSLKEALFNLCQIVWKTEEIPLKWHKSTLIQLSKRRGLVGDLDNIRHIHD